ncbi:MAG TPA: hypothetical protein VLM37_00510, partial [Fibrobacteraceae bacterium]|nr:hypothetical protein [Fibrobacteraceae bacterium]
MVLDHEWRVMCDVSSHRFPGSLRVALVFIGFLWGLASADSTTVRLQWEASVDLRSWTGFRASQFSLDTADFYSHGWFALRVPLANGLAYEQLDGLATLDLRASVDSAFTVESRLPIRRDIEAWFQDDAGGSWLLGANELDINMPILGWAQWNNDYGFFKAGRFKPDLGPSPNSVILGSAPPFQDMVWWQVRFGAIRFDWMISSLNATLTGTPDSVGGDAPVGSETWIQSHNAISNQRDRVYDDPYKTFIMHRLEWAGAWGWIALTEQELIGGKSPALRDLNPWMLWH